MIHLTFLYFAHKFVLSFFNNFVHLIRLQLLAFNLNKSSLGETRCLYNPCFLFTSCLGIQFFTSTLSSQQSQLSYLSLTTPRCAALVWLKRHHAIPLVIKCFHPTLTQGGRGFLGLQAFLACASTHIFILLLTKSGIYCIYMSKSPHRRLISLSPVF